VGFSKKGKKLACKGGSYKMNMVKFYKERGRTLWKNGFISQRKNGKMQESS
jgi:hypothetical protein